MTSSKKLIVVLGPHRSGTSLCTAAIEALGADLRIDEIYVNEDNRKGFFEQPDIVALNEKLLEQLGGVWDNPAFDARLASESLDLSSWRAEASELFHRLFDDVEVVAIKDPRLCQLLSFWQPIFEECGFGPDQTFFIHVVRSPVEVALSQASRIQKNPSFYEYGRVLPEGGALWLSLTRQSLEQTEGCHNTLVSYRALLEDPKRVLRDLARYLDLQPDETRLATFCEGFVDASLHRSQEDVAARKTLLHALPEALEVFEALEALTSADKFHFNARKLIGVLDPKRSGGVIEKIALNSLSRVIRRCRQYGAEKQALQERVESVDAQLIEAVKDRDAVHSELKAASKELDSSLSELENMHGQIEAVRNELEARICAMENSRSWRITAPLRHLGRLRRKASNRLLNFWLGFRRLALKAYVRLRQHFPRTSEVIRKGVVRPVFRFADRHLFSIKQPLLASSRPTNDDPSSLYEAYQAHDVAGAFEPLVSVIVPNYNHATYLRERLDSIYGQTYRRFEVILLDDCSSDESVSILESYEREHPDRTRLVVNEENSGGVFYQWQKGLDLARGEIVWIAESDDACSENFLATLVPFFRNEAVNLAYGATTFIRGTEGEPFWSIQEYLSDIDHDRWNEPFVETAHEIVRDAFSIKNIIPNVSSALFRRQELEVLKDPIWRKMRTCGDWVLYLHLIRGGLLGYSPDAVNYYRIHGANTSVDSYKDDAFYIEHEIVAKTVQMYFDVPDKVFRRQRGNLIEHWRQTRDDFSRDRFEACYSLDRIRDEASERFPNLLMAGYGFCAGGGETFPIQLANLMKRVGYNVTFLDCHQEPRVEEIRRRLRPDIPVVTDVTGLQQITERFGIDVIHSHHAWVDNTILNLLPESSPVKTVVTLHGMYETIEDTDLQLILPRLAERSARIVYTAEKNLGALKAHGLADRGSIVRIDNALDVYPCEPIDRAQLGIAPEAFVLTLVSRAIPDKGWYEAIEAVEAARARSGQDIHLVLIGEGPVYDELTAAPPPGYVHLEGFRNDIRGYFAASDLGFLPSRFEGESFPLVVIDCLHTGTPVLASAVGEIPYMLQTDTGVAGELFELDGWSIDVTDLGERIARLANDEAGMAELKTRVPEAAARFDPEVLSEQYDRAYRAALATDG
ncbi:MULTISPECIES: glycosyltransferase [unclassified Guyparkeria]|uniref:glycosyltransferase n=1 Tax=unclassified Guyparkeria TaxID=2626246 RepID=UPI0007339511|nr:MULTISPECIES: glycosyltransferase [unclassified Guyparkeria]KTG16283.1 hypothetical protein AUR63_05510 [Guyparkeria sp. XI15]OAE85134.1 hypothetical protein AWR35_05520 [Guyparkeria sp. WRN-7]